jgi:hypothetical protein
MNLSLSTRRSRSLFLLASLLSLLALQAARADTVWLDNGDRLTGTVKSLDSGILLMGTDYGGDIRVTFSHVKTLQSSTALVIRDKSVAREYEAKLMEAKQGSVELDGVEQNLDGSAPIKADVPLSDIQSINRPHPLLRDVSIKGKLDLSLNQKTAATDTEDYAAALHTEARHGLWRHTLDASYARSKDDGTIGTDNYSGEYTLDRFYTEKAFWQGRLLHRQDWVEQVRRQTAYGTGPGYQFWDDEMGAFSLSALLGGVNYHYDDGTSDSSAAGSVRWNYVRYLSGKQYELYTHGELLRPLGSGAKIAINGEMGARYNMNKWLNLYVKYARDQVSGSRQTMNESIYGTGIGVTW